MPNFLDSAIALFSPSLALTREKSRQKLEAIRNFDGAKSGNRTAGWDQTFGLTGSANATNGIISDILRNRSRDLTRNNPWAGKALLVIETNTVGYGIVTNIKAKAKTRKDRVNKAWLQWSESTSCDYDGRLAFPAIQALILRSVVESGEVFIRKRAITLERMGELGLNVPFQLQILESDYLDSNKNGASELSDGNYMLSGIEFNSQGDRVYYWLHPYHPGDSVLGLTQENNFGTSSRVPASEILHVYRQDRPGQIRGIPWASPVMITLRDLQQYSDAELLKQRIAACSVAVITETEIPDYATLPISGDLNEDLGISDRLTPGAIEILPPGKDVKFNSPPQNLGYVDHTRSKLHEISCGYGISYESLTGDYSQVNFSSARMAHIEMGRMILKIQWNILIPLFLKPVWRWFSEFSIFSGLDTTGVEISFTCPKVIAVDPNKEGAATLKAVRGGLMSLSEAQREAGYDPIELMEEIKAERKLYKDTLLDSIPTEIPTIQPPI